MVRRPVGEVLAEVSALLDGVESGTSLLSDAERLALVDLARRVAGRAQVLASLLASEVQDAGAADRASGVPLVS